jgi:hypothetical protein
MTDFETEMEFRAVVNGKKIAVVCFHSTRSAYSRRTVQILTVAKRNFPAAEFCLVDADRLGLLSLLVEFKVVGLPTILVFRSGGQVESLVGERSEKVFLGFLEKLAQRAS